MEPDKQEISRNPDGTYSKGVSGNPNGRPKRKTLTELIHERLDKEPNGWSDLVEVIIRLAKGRDRDIIKELWHYTDGMPKQRGETDITSKGEKIEGNTIVFTSFKDETESK